MTPRGAYRHKALKPSPTQRELDRLKALAEKVRRDKRASQRFSLPICSLILGPETEVGKTMNVQGQAPW